MENNEISFLIEKIQKEVLYEYLQPIKTSHPSNYILSKIIQATNINFSKSISPSSIFPQLGPVTRLQFQQIPPNIHSPPPPNKILPRNIDSHSISSSKTLPRNFVTACPKGAAINPPFPNLRRVGTTLTHSPSAVKIVFTAVANSLPQFPNALNYRATLIVEHVSVC